MVGQSAGNDFFFSKTHGINGINVCHSAQILYCMSPCMLQEHKSTQGDLFTMNPGQHLLQSS